MKKKMKCLQSTVLSGLSLIYMTGCVATSSSPGNLSNLIAVADIEEQGIKESHGGAELLPVPLKCYLDKNKLEGMRNQVLHDMEMGVSALELGQYTCAKTALVDAYNIIETIYADDEAAKAARSNFVPESNKDFKGEPYERAMVGYYLGLSDLMGGDLENAKVSFKWGEFQDTMSSSEDYQSDMSLMNFLSGWVDQCNGDLLGAKEHYDTAKKYNENIVIPEDSHNVLFIGETGSGPVKRRSGKYGEALYYAKSNKDSAQKVDFLFGRVLVPGTLSEDVYWQATTLGGRQIDKILAGKAQFKAGAGEISDAAAGAAAVGVQAAAVGSIIGNSDLSSLGAGVAVAGALISWASKAAEKAANPEADIRYWSNLPEHIHVATVKMEGELPDVITARYFYDNGTPQKTDETTMQKTGECYLAWSRDSTSYSFASWDSQDPQSWVVVETTPPEGTQK